MTDTTRNAAIHIARRATDSVVGVGDTRGWDRPKEYDRLVAVSAAAKAAVRDAEPPRYPPPTKPADVDAWLTKTVQARLDATGRRAAAEELALDVDRQIAILGPALAADATPHLVQEFAEHVAAYKALADAPRELSGHEDEEQTRGHLQLLRLAQQLSADLGDRGLLATALNEGEDIGHALVWLAISPAADAFIGRVDEMLKRFNASIPRSPGDWDELLPIGLTLAGVGEVRARRERHGLALWARGQGADGGLGPDMSYGEVEQRAGQRGQMMQAESSRVFANAEAHRL